MTQSGIPRSERASTATMSKVEGCCPRQVAPTAGNLSAYLNWTVHKAPCARSVWRRSGGGGRRGGTKRLASKAKSQWLPKPAFKKSGAPLSTKPAERLIPAARQTSYYYSVRWEIRPFGRLLTPPRYPGRGDAGVRGRSQRGCVSVVLGIPSSARRDRVADQVDAHAGTERWRKTRSVD